MRETGQGSKHNSWSQSSAKLLVARGIRLKTENSRSELGGWGKSGDPRTNAGEAILSDFIVISPEADLHCL